LSTKKGAKKDRNSTKCSDPTCQGYYRDSVFRNALLYDTGSTDYIVNDKKWFDKDYRPNNRSLGTVYTGGGSLKPQGIGTAIFKVLVQKDPLKYIEL
jgi:hypothetical protein